MINSVTVYSGTSIMFLTL